MSEQGQAIVAGGTGLVGSALLDLLSAEGIPTLAVGRRTGAPRIGVLWKAMDLGRMTRRDVPDATAAAFCALGTTIGEAGSQDAFQAVDHGLVLAFARACRAAGVPTFVVVSALGADERSRIFYNRVKGEVERDLRALEFPSLTILRPSLLLGERAVPRRGERIAAGVGRFLRPVLPRALRGVPAADVARAMLRAARAAPPGVHLVRNQHILRPATGARAAMDLSKSSGSSR